MSRYLSPANSASTRSTSASKASGSVTRTWLADHTAGSDGVLRTTPAGIGRYSSTVSASTARTKSSARPSCCAVGDATDLRGGGPSGDAGQDRDGPGAFAAIGAVQREHAVKVVDLVLDQRR